MKRVRLDIGAFNASPGEGGSFMFFLYREGMNTCLPVSLTPPDMHALLANFKQMPGDTVSPQSLFFFVLQEFKIELLEVTVVKADKEDDFMTRLLFFDGEKEVVKDASFTDGIILSRYFSCPIYISEKLLEKYATNIDIVAGETIRTEFYVEKLKEQLKEAIKNEDYEKAAMLSEQISKFEDI